ncbi:hypothetical protein [Sphingobium yanoikuyae]|uniref:hypothetical protein n=1 Tax=Sphingobium yanoikuyae TaxID=13690 RepID=UPI003F116978
MHSEDDDEPRGLWAAISAKSGVIIGSVGLIAWQRAVARPLRISPCASLNQQQT